MDAVLNRLLSRVFLNCAVRKEMAYGIIEVSAELLTSDKTENSFSIV